MLLDYIKPLLYDRTHEHAYNKRDAEETIANARHRCTFLRARGYEK